MKKQLFTIVALGALALGGLRSSGQGDVAFANQTTTAITDANGQKLAAPAGTCMFGLYVGVAGSQASALTLVATGLNANWAPNSSADGFFSIANPLILPNGYPGAPSPPRLLPLQRLGCSVTRAEVWFRDLPYTLAPTSPSLPRVFWPFWRLSL